MYSTVIVPRVSETDGVGHINNTTLPVWFEAGRLEIFKLFTPDLSFHQWKMIIVKTTLQFKHQVHFGADAEVKIWVKRIGNSSLELYEELWQNETLCAQNEAVYVNFDLEAQKAAPIPEEIKRKLSEHTVEEENNERSARTALTE